MMNERSYEPTNGKLTTMFKVLQYEYNGVESEPTETGKVQKKPRRRQPEVRERGNGREIERGR